MGPVILFCNLIQHILCFHPFPGTDKSLMVPHRNNPFTNGFPGKKLWEFGIEKGGILILNFHLVGLIISSKPMLTIKVGRFSKQVPVMLQKIVVGIFICHAVDRIPQYQPDGGCGKLRAMLRFIFMTIPFRCAPRHQRNMKPGTSNAASRNLLE